MKLNKKFVNIFIIFTFTNVGVYYLYTLKSNVRNESVQIIPVVQTVSSKDITTVEISTIETTRGDDYKDDFNCLFAPPAPDTLPDVLQEKPTNKNVIIFHETNCRKMSRVVLTSRQACSIESAALKHPNSVVYILITAPTTIGQSSDLNDRVIRALTTYTNVKFFHLDIKKYFEGTPVSELFKSKKYLKSKYLVHHLSDVMRYISMWRYGAMYLDMDVIVLKNMDDLPPSFAALQSNTEVVSGVLRFAKDEKGRKWSESILNDLNKNFQPESWSFNSNEVLMRFLSKICTVPNIGMWNKETCQGFEIFKQNIFYPIPYQSWRMYFERQYINDTKKLTEHSRAIHFWNNLSVDAKIQVATNNSILELFAREHCPKVYSRLDKYF